MTKHKGTNDKGMNQSQNAKKQEFKTHTKAQRHKEGGNRIEALWMRRAVMSFIQQAGSSLALCLGAFV
jgi:hypothetical protein